MSFVINNSYNCPLDHLSSEQKTSSSEKDLLLDQVIDVMDYLGDDSLKDFLNEKYPLIFYTKGDTRSFFNEKFNLDELKIINFDLTCYQLAGWVQIFKTLHEFKKWLGIHHVIDILASDDWIKGTPLENFYLRFQKGEIKSTNAEFQEFSNELYQCMDRIFTLEYLFDLFELMIKQEGTGFFDEYTEYFEEMNKIELFRWLLFMTGLRFLVEPGSEGLTSQPENWPASIKSSSLFSLIQKLDLLIISEQNIEKKDLSIVYLENNQQKRNIEIPVNMVKWMPNAGNTCYISSVLWPLYFLLKNQIALKIDEFNELKVLDFGVKKIEDLDKELQNSFHLKKAFALLFSALDPQSQMQITQKEVGEFRQAISKSYPDNFQLNAQEDAYDLLIYVMDDLLEFFLKTCDVPKFYTYHEYLSHECISNDALKPCFSPQPNYILEIRFTPEEKPFPLKMSDLLTKIRQTEDVERIIESKKINVGHQEKYMVKDKASAPEYLIARLSRFNQNLYGEKVKRFDCVLIDTSVEISSEKENENVSYDLVAITNHIGDSIHAGHYIAYIPFNGKWYCYNDLNDKILECSPQEVSQKVSFNAYIVYYKQREEGQNPPDPLPEPKVLSLKKESDLFSMNNQHADSLSIHNAILELLFDSSTENRMIMNKESSNDQNNFLDDRVSKRQKMNTNISENFLNQKKF